MALEGSLESFSIAEIFQLIATQGKTGVLEIDTGSSVARIRFVNGQILDAYPGKDEPTLYIGNMMVRAGLVTESQLEYALGMQKKNLRKLGDILIRMGTIRTREFQEMLALQRREMAYSLLRLKRGNYKFNIDEVFHEEGVDTLMSVDAILMEGSRQMDEWPEVLRKVPSDSRIYMRKSDTQPKRALSQEEVIVLGLLDGSLTVREAADRSRLGEFSAFDAIAKLYDQGLIVAVDVQKRRTVKPPRDFTLKDTKTASGMDGIVAAGLAFLALALLFAPSLLLPAKRMSTLGAVKAAKADIAMLESRFDQFNRRTPMLPEKIQRQKANPVIPVKH